MRPAATGTPERVLEGHKSYVLSVAWSADGRRLASGSDDKTVRVWSARTGELLRTIRLPRGPGDIGKIYAVAISPGGELVAAGVNAHEVHTRCRWLTVVAATVPFERVNAAPESPLVNGRHPLATDIIYRCANP